MIEKLEKSEAMVKASSENDKRFMMQQHEQQVALLKEQLKMKGEEAEQLRS